MNSIIYIRKLVFIPMIMSLFSCNDLFSYKKNIVGKYYLMETETKNGLAIYYKTNDGDFIGRIPANVLSYGFNDSFIVTKNKELNLELYYILNRTKDFDYAEQKDFLITQPLTEKEYNEMWKLRLQIDINKH